MCVLIQCEIIRQAKEVTERVNFCLSSLVPVVDVTRMASMAASGSIFIVSHTWSRQVLQWGGEAETPLSSSAVL